MEVQYERSMLTKSDVRHPILTISCYHFVITHYWFHKYFQTMFASCSELGLLKERSLVRIESLRKLADTFSIMTSNAGITTSTNSVENARPKQSVIAIGTMYMAKLNVSNMSGPKPAIVVSEVRLFSVENQ